MARSKHRSKPEISIVLPTSNELANLKILIPQIRDQLKKEHIEIIIVDDASNDGSVKWLKQLAKNSLGIKPIFGSTLKGIGNALRRGYNASQGSIIVSLDADLSFETKVIPQLIKAIRQGNDLALGSRHMQGGVYEAPKAEIKRKQLTSKVANAILNFFIHVNVSDFSANCRAIRKSLWKKLKLKEKTNIWLIEMIVESAIHKASILQIPVRFRDRRYGTSKLLLGKEIFFTGYRVIGMIIRFNLS